MSYTADTGAFVSKATGKQAIADYVGSQAYTEMQDVKAHYFGKNKILDLFNQTGCIGVRIWYGFTYDAQNTPLPQLYLVGVDANGNDILPGGGNDLVLDASMPCPRYCPTGSSLEV